MLFPALIALCEVSGLRWVREPRRLGSPGGVWKSMHTSLVRPSQAISTSVVSAKVFVVLMVAVVAAVVA